MIHSPRSWCTKRFLSTPSARRATRTRPTRASSGWNFYPRPPRGGRLLEKLYPELLEKFLSTPSARRATCDMSVGEQAIKFLSTPSARRATPWHRRTCWPKHISIHALREEGDNQPGAGRRGDRQFLSTPSARRATVVDDVINFNIKFLSTPSARRATISAKPVHLILTDFYPRPPRGGRRVSRRSPRRLFDFYPRPPRGGRQQKQRQNLYFQTNYTTFCTNLEEP